MAQFGRYEILERIGVGGMAEVYRAKAYGASGFHKNLVVKKILPHLSHDPRFRSMFVDEAKIAVHLQHQNVVQILDLGRIDDQLFIAMELVEGADLARTFVTADKKGRRFPQLVALFVIREALQGLHYAHTKAGPDGESLGIIHRDVSPANILLSLAGEVKIGDFGIAKAAQKTNTTKTGIVKGKLHYMAPEQLRAKPLDPTCDVYGMGMVLHTLLSGRHPFEGLAEVDVIDLIRAGTIPPPSKINPEVPSELDTVTMRAIALEPAGRYPSALAFGEAIWEYANNANVFLDPRGLADFMNDVWDAETLRASRAEDAAKTGASIVKRIGPIPSDESDEESFTVLETSERTAVPAAPPSNEFSAPVDSLADELEGNGPLSVEREAIGKPSAEPSAEEPMPQWMRITGISAAVVLTIASLWVLIGPGSRSGDAQPTTPVVQADPGMGVLDISVEPWATIWIDDERIGGTPLVKQLPPGSYTLRYETPDGQSRETTIEIRESKTNRIRL